MKILIINGPNLNMLGKREPDIYGSQTLEQINVEIAAFAAKKGVSVEFFHSNSEGGIIDRLHAAAGQFDGVILNAGAYTHYSYAIADAISSAGLPCVEVHMSNVHAREEFRHNSVLAKNCRGVICGFGVKSYILALEALA